VTMPTGRELRVCVAIPRNAIEAQIDQYVHDAIHRMTVDSYTLLPGWEGTGHMTTSDGTVIPVPFRIYTAIVEDAKP
jgi:hypothetical protein